MATSDLIAATVLDASAALLNDVSKTVYTDAAQIPYLNIALQELQEEFELCNVPVTDTASAAITVLAGYTAIAFNAVGPAPALPSDMIEPQILWERPQGINPYVEMTKVDNLPRWMEGTLISQLQWYVWQSQEIRFLPANANIDVKIDYIRQLFTPVVNAASTINVINAATYLQFRTAALSAKYIGENQGRSDELNVSAMGARDRVTGIGAKGRQGMVTRRRPFRQAYKRRAVG